MENFINEPNFTKSLPEGNAVASDKAQIPEIFKADSPVVVKSQQIEVAEKHLVQLGALGPDKPFKITPLGRTANLFPVSPRYANLFHITR